jgi:hypothetical protein
MLRESNRSQEKRYKDTNIQQMTTVLKMEYVSGSVTYCQSADFGTFSEFMNVR